MEDTQDCSSFEGVKSRAEEIEVIMEAEITVIIPEVLEYIKDFYTELLSNTK